MSSHRAWRDEIVDRHGFAGLAVTVDTADPLLDPHRVPGNVVVHQAIAELEVQSFRADLGGQQHVDRIGIPGLERKSATKRAPIVIGDIAMDDPHSDPFSA